MKSRIKQIRSLQTDYPGPFRYAIPNKCIDDEKGIIFLIPTHRKSLRYHASPYVLIHYRPAQPRKYSRPPKVTHRYWDAHRLYSSWPRSVDIDKFVASPKPVI